MSEKRQSSERIYKGRVINLRVDTVEFENGQTGKREVIEHNGAVAIVPMLGDQVLMVSQFRTPAGKNLLEIPAGSINKGENPEECAYREIIEEIQYKAGKLERLFAMYVAPGYSTEVITVFLATDLTPQAGVGDEDEFIEIEKFTLAEAVAKIDSGEIEDAKTIAGLLAVQKRIGESIQNQ